MIRRFFTPLVFTTVLLATCATTLHGADWPTWRYDMGRTASSPETLAPELHLQWSREMPAARPAWPEDVRVGFDSVYEPIVVGDTLYLASMVSDSLTALDTKTGAEKWRFYAGGPVRLAPTYHEGRLYFGADDANFYCLAADTGKLLWKFNVASSDRMVLGNDRLISVWPVRGGTAIADGVVYFTAGVWPFEGTFLHAVDINSGQPVGDATPVDSHPSYKSTVLTDISPQGYLTIAGRRLYIPCGRSKATCVDLDSGQIVNLNYDSKGKTDYHVVAAGDWLLHGDTIYDAQASRVLAGSLHRPVVSDDMVFASEPGAIVAVDRLKPELVETKDRRGNVVKSMKLSEVWRLASDEIVEVPPVSPDGIETPEKWVKDHPLELFLRAGDRLYGHQGGTIFAVDIPPAGEGDAAPTAVRSWRTPIEGTPGTMAAADGRLFVVTKEGRLLCYGAEATSTSAKTVAAQDAPADEWTKRAASLLEESGVHDGYCLALGVGSGRLIEELVRQSELSVIAIDPDAEKVAALRRQLDDQGLYGTRVTIEVGDPLRFGLPPYIASLVVSEEAQAAGTEELTALAKKVFHSLRPYGGAAWLPLAASEHETFESAVKESALPAAEVARASDYSVLRRVGALPGSADWTHEYGDASNTLMSHEELVRAPLGVLWFGGPSAMNDIYYDRHEWGPSMAVIDGRIFINGLGKLTAVDVYTGRVLWQNELPRGTAAGRAGNFTSAGYHFCVTHDGLYIAYDDVCHYLDPATGKELGTFKLPEKEDQWGRFRVLDDVLIVEVFQKVKIGVKWPVKLVALDRHDGHTVWERKAESSYPFFAIGTDRIYCVDTLLPQLYHDMRRKGLVPKAEADRLIVALDAKTGEIVWQKKTDFIPTWLSYSSDLDVVVASSKSGIIAHRGQTGEPLWQRNEEGEGFSGHPESVWDKVILWKDRVIDQRGPGKSYYLETGEPIVERHAITGEPVPWEFTKTGHHCNYAIASPHLMTFRAADAGFFDMVTGGTSRLKGFRSGCRNSLIPADGVLNAPNFASGCVCGYSLFTSLSFVHDPDAELWTYSAIDAGVGEIRRVGLNLGAPGDRTSESGTMWLDYPSVGGPSPDVPVVFEADNPSWFRGHASQIDSEGADPTWVASSGVEGVKSIAIPLNRQSTTPRNYTVRLFFAEPQATPEGPRVFDVAIGKEPVLEDFDVVAAAGGPRRMVVKTFEKVKGVDEIRLTLTPRVGRTLLCGVEVIADEEKTP